MRCRRLFPLISRLNRLGQGGREPILTLQTVTFDTTTGDEVAWVSPADFYSIVSIECWGSAALGGARASGSNPESPRGSGSGSGGGAYAKSTDATLTLVKNHTYSVLVGYRGQASYVKDGSPGPTGPTPPPGTLVYAAASVDPSDGYQPGAAVAGQAADCIGEVAYSGGNGADGVADDAGYFGDGGGGGGPGGPSGPGTAAVGTTPGHDATNTIFGGIGYDPGPVPSDGNGQSPGGGAGGGGNVNSEPGLGKVVIKYYSAS